MIIYPKTPEPTIIDGRMVYTYGQLKQYAKDAVELNTDYYEDEPATKPISSDSNPFGNIFGDIFTKGTK